MDVDGGQDDDEDEEEEQEQAPKKKQPKRKRTTLPTAAPVEKLSTAKRAKLALVNAEELALQLLGH